MSTGAVGDSGIGGADGSWEDGPEAGVFPRDIGGNADGEDAERYGASESDVVVRVVDERDADENDVDENDADEDDADEDDANGCDMDETVPPPVTPAKGGGGKEEEAEAAVDSFDVAVKREAIDCSNESCVTMFSRK